MEVERQVLACVDQSGYAEFVADYAAWAARSMDYELELLHVIDRHPETATRVDRTGTIGFDAQENLLEQLSSDDESRSREARESGRLFLNALRERVAATGVKSVDIRQRYGGLEETLIEQEDEVRLFVLGRRGESADQTQRDLGRNVESIVRGLKKPVLTVTDTFREPKSALIAFDGSTVTRRGVKMIAGSPLFTGMPVHILMSGKLRGDAKKQLNWAQETLQNAGFEAPASLVAGDAEREIARYIKEKEIDILTMGAYSHSPLRSLLFGSKTTDLLRVATIPTLLLR
ncbi:UspA [Luminiphilus syltensis NOR5-1B]|uniref:UspA n=1 Tax=Luminiphilus syltensis NOR5-1B TaxID=565045 RepID=B8KWR3_9GAMM|nr:universal stress protein [Luminiphilus syltensis]EED35592.1 UspA [Luminiphilus syltensis NOR5-1B]